MTRKSRSDKGKPRKRTADKTKVLSVRIPDNTNKSTINRIKEFIKNLFKNEKTN